MSLQSLEEVEREVKRLAAIIGAPDAALPTFGSSRDGGYPHIEVNSNSYYFVVVERGQELERRTTPDLDRLLYIIFESVTSDLAGRYELAHRVEGKDSRRLRFQKQIELLGTLSPQWAEWRRADQDAILQKHPYDDDTDARVSLTVELRAQGHSPDDAWKLACARYPLPKGS